MSARARQRRATKVRRQELYEEAAAIIALEYREALALEEVAHRLASSPRQLQRAFAEAGQTSFRAHVQRVRMQRAAEMLAAGMTVGDVAVAVGYRQPAQFTRAFRTQHGNLPSAVKVYGRPAPRVDEDTGDLGATAVAARFR